MQANDSDDTPRLWRQYQNPIFRNGVHAVAQSTPIEQPEKYDVVSQLMAS